MTVEQGQELRKKGMYLVTNRDMTKVLAVSDNYKGALAKAKNGKIWGPLSKMDWTKEDTRKALEELSLGVQCNF